MFWRLCVQQHDRRLQFQSRHVLCLWNSPGCGEVCGGGRNGFITSQQCSRTHQQPEIGRSGRFDWDFEPRQSDKATIHRASGDNVFNVYGQPRIVPTAMMCTLYNNTTCTYQKYKFFFMRNVTVPSSRYKVTGTTFICALPVRVYFLLVSVFCCATCTVCNM